MFRKSNKQPQLDAFGSVYSHLDGVSFKLYTDENHWHNQFREQVAMKIDETHFKGLFNDTMGAPNAPLNLLCGMMILKESFGWSDSQLFEHCRFDLLTRSSLGLININDPLPVESTYYLFRKRIYEYQKQNGEDLMGKAFQHITQEQIKAFDVNGHNIRMDSKLMGSNIAFYSRYEIIHQTLLMFCQTISEQEKLRLSQSDRDQLEKISKEDSGKTVYRSNTEEIKTRLQSLGVFIYKLLTIFTDKKNEAYQLLQRVFSEQYRVSEDQQIEIRPKEEITSASVQSPHDPECSYRNKNGQQVKGYSVNITETCSKDSLNLITDVNVATANTPDTNFVQDAITATAEVTGQKVEAVYLDGAFHSPSNDKYCKEQDIDLVLAGIQGSASRYDLEMTPEGVMVTDAQTGECVKAVLARKTERSKQDKWRISTVKGYRYFSQQAVNASMLRKKMKDRPREELNKRNNVEATVFQLSYPLRNNKSKYRGLYKQQMWAYCRCTWINLVRIINFTKQTCQRTFKTMEIPSKIVAFCEYLLIKIDVHEKISRCFLKIKFFVFYRKLLQLT
jgi:hypothetical protein